MKQYFRDLIDLSVKDFIIYFASLLYGILCFIRDHILFFAFAACCILFLYGYFFNLSLLLSIMAWYEKLERMEKFQVLMNITIIIGFFVSYYTSIRIEKKKKVIEVKFWQAHNLTLYSQRMAQFCIETNLICSSFIEFKEMKAALDQPSLVYWSSFYKKRYYKYLKSKSDFEMLLVEYRAFIQVHNVSHLKYATELNKIASLSNDVLTLGSIFDTILDVSDDDKFIFLVDTIESKSLFELREMSSQNQLKLIQMEKLISNYLCKGVFPFSWSMFSLTFKNPALFNNAREVLRGEKTMDTDHLKKMFNED